MLIIGAGMAGCIAAIMNTDSTILEASETPPTNHNAVLRFRESRVSQVTGIEFKKVTVRKSIWWRGEQQPSPRIANLYSQKVSGKILNRSIWNLDTVERYIAPPDFHKRMLDRLASRIEYGNKIELISKELIYSENKPVLSRASQPVISTMPIHLMSKVADDINGVLPDLPSGAKDFQKIATLRAKVENCQVHQTIYYPDPTSSLYRATLTGEDLIIEFMDDGSFNISKDCDVVLESFGLRGGVIFDSDPKPTQQYGKISPFNDEIRRRFIFKLSTEFGIYSLGRFGTWRNILLDDVVDDVNKINRLIQNDLYYNHLSY